LFLLHKRGTDKEIRIALPKRQHKSSVGSIEGTKLNGERVSRTLKGRTRMKRRDSTECAWRCGECEESTGTEEPGK